MSKAKQLVCALPFIAVSVAVAGNLTVEGDLSVTSNLVSRSVFASNATFNALVVDGQVAFTGTIRADGASITNLSGANLRGESVGTGALEDGAVTSKKIAAGSVGISKAAHTEWNRWGDGRYLCLAGAPDLILNPGRISAGLGLSLSNMAAHAFGASQHGAAAAGASAVNNGKGSLQLFCLTNSQVAFIAGHASIGMGACVVTNDQALVAGDGLSSHGKGTVTAVGFYGSGEGLFNLNLAAYAGDNLTWDPVSNRLNAATGANSNGILSVLSTIPGWSDGDDDSRWSGAADGLDPVAARRSLGLGSAATNEAGAFAPADLSAYASGTVTYSNKQFHVSGQAPSADAAQAVLAAWPDLDTDALDDLTTAGATMAGDLDMGGHRVKSLPPPQAERDAVTKEYLRQVLSKLPPQGDLSMGAFTNGAPGAFPLVF